jgi:hypothetical protein
MYVAMRAFRAVSGAADEVRRRVQEGLVPLIARIPGLSEQHVMDAPDDTVTLVSIFTDQAGADECSRIADEWAPQYLVGLIQAPPDAAGPEGAPETT